jgi:KTSC domain
MNYVSVSSSNIAAIAYEPETSTLGVRFLNGGEYHYFAVPEGVFLGLQSASSVGSYFDQYVKKAGYSFSKVG